MHGRTLGIASEIDTVQRDPMILRQEIEKRRADAVCCSPPPTTMSLVFADS
jgi:hypothetical protein